MPQGFLDQQGKGSNGRPPTGRTERLNITVTPENKQFINDFAEKRGIKYSDAFELILEAAKKTLENA
jgi:uncharacterized protein (DUF1778 family)